MTATVAIVGRPNVGKSTLFNRILGGRRAIVDDRPGVTRDRHFARATWGGRDFWLVDTGGWTVEGSDALADSVRRQIEIAVSEADAVLFVVDVKAGVHPADLEVAALLRPHQDRVLLAVNKMDDLPGDQGHLAFYELGLGEPHPVSAATGKATGDLLDLVLQILPPGEVATSEDTIEVAVIGRPNVGKSSIMNRLIGQERSIVDAKAGTTRDAVDFPLRYHGRTLNFIDTAGLRKRSKVEDEIEFYSALRTERAIERADICVLVVDATEGMHVQDLRITHGALDRGAGLIVAVNKWDLVTEKDPNTALRGERVILEKAPFLEFYPFVYVSALTGLRMRKILDLILETAAARERRIATAEVNRVLADLVANNQPPQHRGREVKLMYASQVGARPPTFAIVCNYPEGVPESYRRYLERGLRSAWSFVGAPIRIKLRRRKRERR